MVRCSRHYVRRLLRYDNYSCARNMNDRVDVQLEIYIRSLDVQCMLTMFFVVYYGHGIVPTNSTLELVPSNCLGKDFSSSVWWFQNR